MTFLYQLANNPEVQEKLRKEINEFSSKSEGITFDVLNEMPYLDQVLNGSRNKIIYLNFL